MWIFIKVIYDDIIRKMNIDSDRNMKFLMSNGILNRWFQTAKYDFKISISDLIKF